MALLSDLVAALAKVEGIEESFVAGVARYLREAGMVSQAGRGRGAARMVLYDAVSLIIAVNATTQAKEAPEALRYYANLEYVDKRAEITKEMSAEEPMTDWAIRPGVQFFVAIEKFLSWSVPLQGLEQSLHNKMGPDFYLTISFNKTTKTVSLTTGHHWNNPDNEGDAEGSIFAYGEFQPEGYIDSDHGDRTEIVMITYKTLLAMSDALAN